MPAAAAYARSDGPTSLDAAAHPRRDLGRELHVHQDRPARLLARDDRLAADRARGAGARRARRARGGRSRASGAGSGRSSLLGAVQVAGPFLLIAAGQQEISSSLAGILVTSAPLFTALLAIWIDQEERSQGLRLVGVVLGVAGVARPARASTSAVGRELLGGLAVVLAGLGYAVGGFIVKHRLADLPPLGVAAWVMVASTVLLAAGRRRSARRPRLPASARSRR